jgi:hypothetical protein
MKQHEEQVQQWRTIADDMHPAGPLFTMGLYAEADITLTGMDASTGTTGEFCTDGCTDDRVDPTCITRDCRVQQE